MPQAMSFMHPLLMWVLLGLMLCAGYLGFQAGQLRRADPDQRKKMIPKQFGTRHAALGRWIVILTLLGSAGGIAVTYANNGKLILGPHLVVGLSLVVLVLCTAALGPALQKGQNWARGLHIGLNAVLLALFGWQAVSGVAILNKLLNA